MTPAERNRRKRRLERAGWVYRAGWFKPGFASRIDTQIESYADEIERDASSDLPKGRPPKP